MYVFYLCVRTYSQKHSITYAPSSCNYSERVHCLQRLVIARQEKSAVLHQGQKERHLGGGGGGEYSRGTQEVVAIEKSTTLTTSGGDRSMSSISTHFLSRTACAIATIIIGCEHR